MRPSEQRVHLPHRPVPCHSSKADCIVRHVRFFASACALGILGPSVTPPWWAEVKPSYRQEVLAFMDECGPLCPPLQGLNLSVTDALLPPLPDGGLIVGRCRVYIQGLRLIREVRVDLFYAGSDLQRKATLWHELLHCVAGSDHTPEGEMDLMDPYDKTHYFYVEHWDTLVKNSFCRIARERGMQRKGCTE